MTAQGQNIWDARDPAVNAAKSTVESSYFPPRKGLSIGMKATALGAIFGVLPVLAVGIIAYRSADSSITERIAQQEIAEVDQLSDQLRQYLQERVANVNTAASMVSDSGLLSGALEPEAQAVAEQQTIQQLTDLVQDYRTYASISVFDLQGNVLVQSRGSALELNQGEALYFQQVKETEAPVLSEPVPIDPDGEDRRLAVYVATPVLNQAGRIQGVVTAKIPVDFIGNAILRTASAGEGTVYRLVDSSGQVFQSLPFDPNDSQLGQPVADALSNFPQINEQKQRRAWIEGSQAGTELLNAYAPLQGFESLEWSVVTSTDTAFAFLAQRQLLQTILFGTAITGITAVLLGIFLAKRTTQPVEQMAQAVELLGKGQLDARVPVRGNDELAILGSNVNRMAEQIQILLQTLRQNAEQLGMQNDVLAGLARNEALIQGDAQAAAQAFTEAIATTLNAKRVSIWIYKVEENQLLCLSRYDHVLQPVSEQRLPVAKAPTYFEFIAENQSLTISDVRRHEAVQELLAEGYIDSGTISLLEVPIQIAGNFIGTVRCEHTDNRREWKPQEQTFVNSVANLMSLALESEMLQEEVSHLLDVVSEVEDGNLITQAKVSDRSTGLVADTFNRLIERLVEVLQQVIDTARQVTESANQQKSQASLIATNAEQQAQGVNRVLRLTEQVEDMAQGSARQVQITNQSLQTIQGAVEQGQETMVNLTQGIGILQEGSDRIIQQMKTLGEFVGLADQFVQDQSQIASLTQTLALNASLVAARAAEQRDPRQFVVAAREFNSIATQVSQLAQQTNDSLITLEQRSAQIHSVVSTIDADVQSLGGLVQEFTQGVEQSTQVFSNVQGGTLEAVGVGETIARSSGDIVRAAQATAELVRDIASIAAKSAELTQSSSIQADQIDILSDQLLKTIEFFQLPTLLLNDKRPSNVYAAEAQAAEAHIDLSQLNEPLTVETLDIPSNSRHSFT